MVGNVFFYFLLCGGGIKKAAPGGGSSELMIINIESEKTLGLLLGEFGDETVDVDDVESVGELGQAEGGGSALEGEVAELAAGDVVEGKGVLALVSDGDGGLGAGRIGIDGDGGGEGGDDAFGSGVGVGVVDFNPVEDADAVEVEAGAVAGGGVGVDDDVAVLVVGGVLGVVGADDVDDADEEDAIDVDIGAVAELLEVEGSAEAGAVFAGEAVDIGGVDAAVGAYIVAGRGEGGGGEADEVLTVGADFDEGEFEEVVVEGVFEDCEVGAFAVGDGVEEGEGGHAAVAKANDVEVVVGAGAEGLGGVAVGDEGGVGVGYVLRAEDEGAAGGPAFDAGVGVGNSLAAFGFGSAAEGAANEGADGSDGDEPSELGGVAEHGIDDDGVGDIAPFHEVAIDDGLHGVAPGAGRAVDVAPPVVVEAVGLAECEAGAEVVVEDDIVDAPLAGEVGEAVVVAGDGVHDGLEGGGILSEADAPGESGVGGSPVDGEDHLVLALAHPVEDAGGSDGGVVDAGGGVLAGINGIDGCVGVDGGGGGGHVEHACAAHFDDVAVLDGLVAVAEHGPGAVEVVAPVVGGAVEGFAVFGVLDVGDEAAEVVGEAGVVGGDGVDEGDGYDVIVGAVPADAPDEGGGGGVVVPGDDDGGLVVAGAAPELDVGGAEVDILSVALESVVDAAAGFFGTVGVVVLCHEAGDGGQGEAEKC